MLLHELEVDLEPNINMNHVGYNVVVRESSHGDSVQINGQNHSRKTHEN
jgi:hypothetical protein